LFGKGRGITANSSRAADFGLNPISRRSLHRRSRKDFVVTHWTRSRALTRRATVAGLFAAPSLYLPNTAARADDTAVAAPRVSFSCIATPQAVAGPYYFDPKLQRVDITEGHPGAPLQIRLVVIDTASCQPLAGTRIDVWHARADGFYSGYRGQGDTRKVDTSGGTFMRGTQETDAQGEARFRTVYPGWYEGRTAHIHFKVFTDQKNVLTAQMYFPDALSQYIYGHVNAYRRKKSRESFNANDGLALMDKTHGGFCDIKEEADHYLATLILGVDRSATALADDVWPPPGLAPEAMSPRHGPVAIVPGVARSEQKEA
jgi:protocatechuate 3,4-dioxygenase beta subunit